MPTPDERMDLAPLLSELRDLLAERSIRHGSFTLTSGARSSYYCDTKATILAPRGAELIGEILCRVLEPRQVEAAGGLAMGAAYIATAVSLVSARRRHPIHGFVVRSQRKEHGLQQEVDQSYHPDGTPLLRPGRRVAVVDDVVTRGGSILKAIEVVAEKGCRIEAVVAIVDRQQGGGELLLQKGLPYCALFHASERGELHASDLSCLVMPGEPRQSGAPSR